MVSLIGELMEEGLLDLIKKAKKTTPAPKLVERSLIQDGSGNYAVTLPKEWKNQYGLTFGDSALMFYDSEVGEIVFLPYTNRIKKFLNKRDIDYREKSLQKFGNSSGGAFYIPKRWKEKLDLAKGDKTMVLSDWRGGIDKWNPEKVRGYHESMAMGVM